MDIGADIFAHMELRRLFIGQFVVTTDGMEGANRKYDYEGVKRLIHHKEEKYGWEFVFLGADIDIAAGSPCFGMKSGGCHI